MTRLGSRLAPILLLLGFLFPASGETAPAPVAIAVLDFDYFDSSGEPRDQSADHARRLNDFMSALRRDLVQGGGYRVVSLDCGTQPCAVGTTTPRELFDAAKKAGARLILHGGVHKMSTLVQWAKTQLIDVEEDRLIDDRWLSFRGDDDESWRRAERFLVKKLVQTRVGGK
jgi:hypothetical protein